MANNSERVKVFRYVFNRHIDGRLGGGGGGASLSFLPLLLLQVLLAKLSLPLPLPPYVRICLVRMSKTIFFRLCRKKKKMLLSELFDNVNELMGEHLISWPVNVYFRPDFI